MGPGLRIVAASPPTEGEAVDDAVEEAGEDVGEESADYRLTRHTRLQAGSEVLMVGTYERVIATFRANEPIR